MSIAESQEHETLSDRDLLARFARSRDEQAFTELVHRHGDLVLGVCQRSLHDRHDAEDAFQATFLVLARDAQKIRNKSSLASWLYGVAYRISLRVHRQRAGRKTETLEDQAMVTDEPFDKLTSQYEQSLTDQELNDLPERLRLPMVLRYVVGKSNSEIANELQLSVSAVEGRLKRARARLRMRLARHGMTLSTGILLLAVKPLECAAQSSSLINVTVSTSLSFQAHGTRGLDGASEQIAQLAQQEIIAMTGTKISKVISLAALVALAATVGIGLRGGIPSARGQERATVKVSADVIRATGADPFAKVTAVADKPTATAARNVSADNGNALMTIPRSAAERRILESLNTPVRLFSFLDAALADVAAELADAHDIQIVIDHQSLEEAQIDSDIAITCDLRNIKLSSALHNMFRNTELDYSVHDEVLVITSADAAAAMLDTRVYPAGILGSVNLDGLVEEIQAHIEPDSWGQVGGNGHISVYRGALVISQSQRIHEKINVFLRQLAVATSPEERQRSGRP